MHTVKAFNSIKFLRPNVTKVPTSEHSVRFKSLGEVITIRVPGGAHPHHVHVHCFLCGAEWGGKWRDDGTPIYSGGLLTSRFRQPGTTRIIRREQACLCDAGVRFTNVQPASERTLRAWKRMFNWRTIRTAQFIVEGAC